MVVKKNGKKAPLDGGSTENNSDLVAMRGTLEDYFNSKKAYQTDQMRGLNKEVTKHLLTGEGDDNAMIMDKQDDIHSVSSTRVEVDEEKEHAEEDAKAGRDDTKPVTEHEDDHHEQSDGGSGDDYEDDYESDSSTTAATEASVAGMTLGDYLHAEGDGLFPLETDKDQAESKRIALKHEKLPQKSGASTKKPLPPAVISGMSLDYYLGASSAAAKDTDGDDGESSSPHPDGKSPPKRKKVHKGKAKSLLAALPTRQPPPPDYTTHDEFATPYQKRMKKQFKQKQQQQGGSVSKSILLGDSSSSSQLLMTKHLPTSLSSSSQPKEKKKHGGSGSQPPLPKLLGSSASSGLNAWLDSSHAFLLASHHHNPHSDGDDDNDYPSGFAPDESADEKLPPLQYQAHASHK